MGSASPYPGNAMKAQLAARFARGYFLGETPGAMI